MTNPELQPHGPIEAKSMAKTIAQRCHPVTHRRPAPRRYAEDCVAENTVVDAAAIDIGIMRARNKLSPANTVKVQKVHAWFWQTASRAAIDIDVVLARNKLSPTITMHAHAWLEQTVSRVTVEEEPQMRNISLNTSQH